MAGFLGETRVHVFGSYQELCEKVAGKILDFSNQTIALRGQFSMVLSGGSTPKGVYQCMASPSWQKKFQWERMHFFLGDERWVPPNDQSSNYRMVSETLLAKVKIPSLNIHFIPTTNCGFHDSARLYEKNIRDFFKSKKGDFPVFDLVLLGIGQDGHTSSLFPGDPALLVKDRLVVPVSPQGTPEERITLSLPCINHANEIFFLVSGVEKAEIVHQVLENEQGDLFLPAK